MRPLETAGSDLVGTGHGRLFYEQNRHTAAAGCPRLTYGAAWKHKRTEELVYKALKAESGRSRWWRSTATTARSAWAGRSGVRTKFTPAEYQDPRPKNHMQQSMTRSFATLGPTIGSVVLHQPAADRGRALRIWRVPETYTPHRVCRLRIGNLSLPHFASLFLVNEPPPTSSCTAAAAAEEETPYAHNAAVRRAEPLLRGDRAYHALTANRGLVVSGSSPARLLADGARVSAEAATYAPILGPNGGRDGERGAHAAGRRRP
ncbi:hypothetical protein DL768_007605 [Monosporascus sp. mg162]|nr:hypothetical protein DL768_007605 [Monosporascus sp. mg162]